MADSVSVTNWPDSGSAERVAFDMMKFLRNHVEENTGNEARRKAFLNLYVDCLNATKGMRPK
jgi:hypothetical protein